MFTPGLYTFWEKLMVSTGLQNNQLFPGISLALIIGLVSTFLNAGSLPALPLPEELKAILDATPALLIAIPLFVALWGATLFTPGATNAGYAKGTKVASD